jgi:uncharacterized protein (TIGR03083 family)
MDREQVWRVIEAERLTLADQLETLSDEQWERASLCSGWRVRDVAAHLTFGQVGLKWLAVELVRARGSFNRMVHETAVRKGREPVGELIAGIRGLRGRRTPPGVSDSEPLTDILVHGQDMMYALGVARPMPPLAARTSADRVWVMGYPFNAQKRLGGLRLQATDVGWAVGEGALVTGPIEAMLLLVTGRTAAALDRLSGDGAALIRERLAVAPAR